MTLWCELVMNSGPACVIQGVFFCMFVVIFPGKTGNRALKENTVCENRPSTPAVVSCVGEKNNLRCGTHSFCCCALTPGVSGVKLTPGGVRVSRPGENTWSSNLS